MDLSVTGSVERPRPNLEVLRELGRLVAERGFWRLHVHPEAVVTILVSVQHQRFGDHVQVVADPACTHVGKGWIEVISTRQWREMLGLVGRRVKVSTASSGDLSGVLVQLDRREAKLDVGQGDGRDGRDLRYVAWLSIEPDGPEEDL